MADTWHGPYRVLGNPHPDDPSHTSYHSQISLSSKCREEGSLHRAGGPLAAEADVLNYEDYADNFEAQFDPACGKKQTGAGWLRR